MWTPSDTTRYCSCFTRHSTQKRVQQRPAPLAIKRWKFAWFLIRWDATPLEDEAEARRSNKINFTQFRNDFPEKFISSFRFLFSFDCATTETETPSFSLLSLDEKIYTKAFITSKNPTEWSFTWIAFNNNPSLFTHFLVLSHACLCFPFPSSHLLALPFKLSLSTNKNIYLWPWSNPEASSHQTQFFVIMTVVLTQFIVVSLNLSGTRGPNVNGKLQFTTSKVPKTTFYTSRPNDFLQKYKLSTHRLHLLWLNEQTQAANCWCCFLCRLIRRLFDVMSFHLLAIFCWIQLFRHKTKQTFGNNFIAAALSQWIIYLFLSTI